MSSPRAGEPLPVGQRAQLDQRREEELARGLEQDLPASTSTLDVDRGPPRSSQRAPARSPSGRLATWRSRAARRSRVLPLSRSTSRKRSRNSAQVPRSGAVITGRPPGASTRAELLGGRARIGAPATARFETSQIREASSAGSACRSPTRDAIRACSVDAVHRPRARLCERRPAIRRTAVMRLALVEAGAPARGSAWPVAQPISSTRAPGASRRTADRQQQRREAAPRRRGQSRRRRPWPGAPASRPRTASFCSGSSRAASSRGPGPAAGGSPS